MSGIIGTSHSKSGIIGRSLDTAKAWVTMHVPSTSAHVLDSSFNISGVSDYGVGQTRYTFGTAMPNVNYAVVGTGDSGGGTGGVIFLDEDVGAASYYGKTTTYFQTRVRDIDDGAMSDSRDSHVIVFGD